MKTLVIYDIRDDNIRNRLAELLKDFGLKRIQKSAFIGELHPIEREKLALILRDYLRDDNDRIDIFVICDKDIKFHRRILPNKEILEGEFFE